MSQEIIAVDHIRMLVTDETGFSFPITNMIDDDNDETADWDAVVAIVAGPDSTGMWWRLAIVPDRGLRH